MLARYCLSHQNARQHWWNSRNQRTKTIIKTKLHTRRSTTLTPHVYIHIRIYILTRIYQHYYLQHHYHLVTNEWKVSVWTLSTSLYLILVHCTIIIIIIIHSVHCRAKDFHNILRALLHRLKQLHICIHTYINAYVYNRQSLAHSYICTHIQTIPNAIQNNIRKFTYVK